MAQVKIFYILSLGVISLLLQQALNQAPIVRKAGNFYSLGMKWCELRKNKWSDVTIHIWVFIAQLVEHCSAVQCRGHGFESRWSREIFFSG